MHKERKSLTKKKKLGGGQKEKKSKWFHTNRVQAGRWAGSLWRRLIQSSQQDRRLTYKAIITLSEKPGSISFAFQSRNKKCGLFILCFVFVWGFSFKFFLLCFVFLVQHNLEHLKAFQPKCGEKTGKAFFAQN